MDIFVKRLNEQLTINKISMYKLAKEINVNKQTVSFWVNGINEPKISYLKALAEYFKVSSDYLLGLSDF